MNTRSPTPWSRLVAAARQAPADSRDLAAPAGFATRVSALALAADAEPSFTALFVRLAPRALGVCALVMVLGVTFNFSVAVQAFGRSAVVAVNDPVAEWFDQTS